MHNSCSKIFFQFSQLPLSTHTKFKGVMKGLALLMLALLAQGNAFHNRSNCTEEFHTILEKAAEIKKKNHCNIRGFYDCCEVYFPGMYTSKLRYLQPLVMILAIVFIVYPNVPICAERELNGASMLD